MTLVLYYLQHIEGTVQKTQWKKYDLSMHIDRSYFFYYVFYKYNEDGIH